MKTNEQAIHIYTIGDNLYVAVEVDKTWVVIGRLHAPLLETTISCIYEPNATPIVLEPE